MVVKMVAVKGTEIRIKYDGNKGTLHFTCPHRHADEELIVHNLCVSCFHELVNRLIEIGFAEWK